MRDSNRIAERQVVASGDSAYWMINVEDHTHVSIHISWHDGTTAGTFDLSTSDYDPEYLRENGIPDEDTDTPDLELWDPNGDVTFTDPSGTAPGSFDLIMSAVASRCLLLHFLASAASVVSVRVSSKR